MALTASSASSAPLSTFKPAIKPPPGVIPNPENPESLAHLSTITISVCIPIVTLFFALRAYARIWVRRTWIFEDYLAVTAWVLTVVYCGIVRATMSHHAGKHNWDISPAQAREALYWFNIAAVVYGIAIGLTKLTVLWLYRRVFSPQRRGAFDITILILILLMIGFYGSTTFVKIFSCTPRTRVWDKTVPGTCVNMAWVLNMSGAFNMVTDYLILLLPIQAVRKMQMSGTKKILVVAVFTFGLCAPIFATIGFVVRLRNTGNPDITWKQPEILLWGAAEVTSGLLCVCFPEIGALLPRSREKSRSRSRPRRPTASDIQGWKEPLSAIRKKHGHDPYATKSMTDTMFSTNAGRTYVELDDMNGNGVHITPRRSLEHMEEPMNGVVYIRSDIRVESHAL